VDRVDVRVARGARYLDELVPGWDKVIDLERLDLASSCACVLGQLALDSKPAKTWEWFGICRFFGLIVGKNRPSDRRHSSVSLGFQAYWPPGHDGPGARSYRTLTAAWRTLIEARRSQS
jgi:hypothetical protein